MAQTSGTWLVVRSLLPTLLVLVGLIVSGAMVWNAAQAVEGAESREARLRETLQRSVGVERTFLIMSGQLTAYALSGDAAFLERYERAHDELERGWSGLAATTAGDGVLESRLVSVRGVLDAWLTEVAGPVLSGPRPGSANAFPVSRSEELTAALRAERLAFANAGWDHGAQIVAASKVTLWRAGGVVALALLTESVLLVVAVRRLGTLRSDLAEHRRILEARRVSDERLRFVLAHLPGGLWAVDTDLRYTLSQGAGLASIGREPGELVGLTLYDFWQTTDPAHPSIAAHLRALQGETVEFEQVVVGRTALLTVAPLSDGQGTIVGVVGVAFDITEQRRAEEAARTGEARLRLMVEASNIGLWDWDLVTNEVYFSPEWKGQIGYADAEIPDRFEEWERRVHPDDLGPTMAHVHAFLNGQVAQHEAEFRFRHKDGSWRWILARADLLRDSGGPPIRMMGCHVDITERKQAEEQLAQHEARLAEAQRLAHVGSWDWDVAAGRFTWSDELYRIFGLAPEMMALTFENVLAYIHPDDRERAQATFETGLRTGEPYAIILRIIRADGAVRVIEGRAAVVQSPAGAPVHVFGTVQDVTERMQAEEALRATQQMLQATVDASPLSVVARDLEGRVILWNRTAEQTFGWAADDVIGRQPPILPESEQAATAELFDQMTSGASVTNVRVVRQRKDGVLLTMRFSGAQLRDARGSVVGVMGIFADVTEQERDQERLLILAAALNAATHAVVVVDHEGVIRWVNPAFTALTGVPAEEAMGQTPLQLRSWPDDDAPHDELWKVIQSGRVWHGQFHSRRRDGTIFVDETTITPIRRADGAISHYVAIKQDVTEREENAEALRRVNRALGEALAELERTRDQVIQQERLRAMGQMASGIAHDFNNALQPIIGLSEILLAYPEKLADRAHATNLLGVIHAASQDAAAVVLKLRELYRPREAGDRLESVRLDELVAQVAGLTRFRWKDQALATGAEIQFEADVADLPPVAGNAAELREGLVNLVLNAVDAMPLGGTLAISGAVDEEMVAVSVRDTGIGMTEEVRRRCLEPFFTTKGEHGTGLGLGLVAGMVERYGGELRIASAPGQGTTVTVRLPIWRAADVAAVPTEVPSVTRPLRILIIEDEPRVRTSLVAYLAQDGHTVETADDGVAGIAAFERGQFDLVLTDRALPRLSGDQVAAMLKRLAPDLPIVMVTGFGDLMNHHDERPPGVDLVLGKPVKLADLRQAIAQIAAGTAD